MFKQVVLFASIITACGVEGLPAGEDGADVALVETSDALVGGRLSRSKLEKLAKRHAVEHMGDAAAMAADRAADVAVRWNGVELDPAGIFASDTNFFGAFPDIHAEELDVLAIDEKTQTVTIVTSYVGTWTGPFALPNGVVLQPPTPGPFVQSPSTVTLTFDKQGKVKRTTMNFDTIPLLRALGLVPPAP
jgi:hypothetical protein